MVGPSRIMPAINPISPELQKLALNITNIARIYLLLSITTHISRQALLGSLSSSFRHWAGAQRALFAVEWANRSSTPRQVMVCNSTAQGRVFVKPHIVCASTSDIYHGNKLVRLKIGSVCG